ncbi:MAG: hypothetical protein FJW31_15535 [Acidobacteria bacterium]|nr:hypothetical protein [Acidobacteriota bacterium]
MVTIEKTAWGGWPNCYRLSNGEVELIVTTDVGPRIMRYAFVGGPNVFLEIPAELGGSGEPDFRPRGGHRLWCAPEQYPLSWAPDNVPVEVRVPGGNTIELAAPPEPLSGLRKTLLIRLASVGTSVMVLHRLENTLAWNIETAAWTLSMMAAGGAGISGFPPRGTHPEMLAPKNPLVMWAFTDFSDPRWTLTKKYVVLRQDAAHPSPMKTGLFNEKTWGAYLLGDHLFLKQYAANPAVRYPDMGCSFEIFANGTTLELETLGPLTTLAPGASLEHGERWTLVRGAGHPGKWTDAAVDRLVGRLL